MKLYTVDNSYLKKLFEADSEVFMNRVDMI